MPREGALIAVTGYRFGGGAAGNVGAGTLTDMRTSLPYVDRVENIAPAIGGVDAETVDNAKRRGPQSLRAGGAGRHGRATSSAWPSEADPAIARVRCLPPREHRQADPAAARARRSSGPASCCSSTTSPCPTT